MLLLLATFSQRVSKHKALSADQLRELGSIHGTWAKVAAHLGVARSTISDRASYLGVSISEVAGAASKPLKPGVVITGDSATVVSAPSPQLGDVSAILAERGLLESEWDVRGLTVNEWEAQGPEGTVITLHQLKITLVKRTPIEFLFPAVDVKQRPAPKITAAKGVKVAICLPDQHAPLHDRAAHQQLLSFINSFDHTELVLLGDLGDYPGISRFRDSGAQKWMSTANECVQASFELLSDYRSNTEAPITLLKGNHDWRIETELAARAERLAGLKPAEIPGTEQVRANSLRHLLHLDRLGIHLQEPAIEGDDYNHAEYWLSEQLVCIHGKSVKNGAEKHAESIGASVIMGHTHKQRSTVVSRWHNDRLVHLDAVEAGTLRELGTSIGYASRPKSQQGFAVATVLADGSHSIELARWDGSAFVFRGQRW